MCVGMGGVARAAAETTKRDRVFVGSRPCLRKVHAGDRGLGMGLPGWVGDVELGGMAVCVIFNPSARGDRARRFMGRLRELAAGVVLKPTSGPGDARRLAVEAVREGFPVVVAAGGDGTVNEVVDGWRAAGAGVGRVSLGVLPLGTMNVFARELGLPMGLEAAWAVATRSRTRRQVRWVRLEHAGAVGGRVAVQLVGAGVDAEAVAGVSWGLKKRFGPLAYAWSAMKALRGQGVRVRVAADVAVPGDAGTRGVRQVVVCKGRLYGGPFALAPGARLEDGFLHVVLLPEARVSTLLWALWAVPGHRYHRLPGLVRFRCREVELTSDGPMPVQVDGDLAGHLPVRLTVGDEVLSVVVPER